MRRPEVLTAEFRTRGLKVTPQRQLLFSLLHGHTGHPTAESLFAEASDRMPGISLRTVYQTVNDLVTMGELHALQFAGGSTRFDPNVDDHHHAHCDVCGELHDVYVDHFDSLLVSGFAGFQPERASIGFGGVCASCREISHPPIPSATNPSKIEKETS